MDDDQMPMPASDEDEQFEAASADRASSPPPSPTSPRVRTKSNEEIIREELRASSQVYMNLWRTGITLMTGAIVAIGFLRREVAEQIDSTDFSLLAIPWQTYLLGSLFLAILAYAFHEMLRRQTMRYRWYEGLLKTECDNALGVPTLTNTERNRSLFNLIFYLFPVFDVYVRIALKIGKGNISHLGYFVLGTGVAMSLFLFFERWTIAKEYAAQRAQPLTASNTSTPAPASSSTPSPPQAHTPPS
jgi:hypothetical protein